MFRIGRGSLLTRTHFHFGVRIRKVAMPPAEKSEELVEAAAVGMKLRVSTKVPFAHRARRVTTAAQGVGKRRLDEGQADRRAGGVPARIEFVSESLLVAPGEKSG